MEKIARLLCFAALLSLGACDKFLTPDSTPESRANAQTLVEQGYDLLDKGQPQMAQGVFDQAILGDPSNVRAMQGKGIALNKLGKHEQAEIAYGKALALSPGSVGITNNLAMSKILRGQYQEAVDILTPLSKNNNQTVQENLALAKCLQGKKDEARGIYSKYLPPAQVEDNIRFCTDFGKMKKGAIAPSGAPLTAK